MPITVAVEPVMVMPITVVPVVITEPAEFVVAIAPDLFMTEPVEPSWKPAVFDVYPWAVVGG